MTYRTPPLWDTEALREFCRVVLRTFPGHKDHRSGASR